MTSARPRPSRWLAERGAVSWVTVLLLAGLVAGAYLLRVWGPIYVVHYEVKQVVRDYGNQAVKNPSDAELKAKMSHKLRTLDTVEGVDEYGRQRKLPAVNVRPDQIVWERTASPPTLRVAFEYLRQVHYPFVGHTREAVMEVDLTMDLARPDWGPTR